MKGIVLDKSYKQLVRESNHTRKVDFLEDFLIFKAGISPIMLSKEYKEFVNENNYIKIDNNY